MNAFVTAKVGTVLAVAAVLAVSMLLAAGSVQAHTNTGTGVLSTPSCSSPSLPDDSFFGTNQITNVTSAAPLQTGQGTKQGGGVTGTGGAKYRYAKIKIPALAAGELRVFDATTSLSDAVLCQGSTEVAKSKTSYTAHNSARTAAKAATDAAAKATAAAAAAAAAITAADGEGTPTTRLSNARTALSTARTALDTARRALSSARTALFAASVSPGDQAEQDAGTARTAEQAALTAYNHPKNALPSSSTADADELTAVKDALGTSDHTDPAAKQVGSALTAAATALTAAAADLNNAANSMHTGFRIRAPVKPGDEEYIVVVAPENPADTTGLNLHIEFNGAIDNTSDATTPAGSQTTKGTLSAGDVDTYTIKVTAPGLLTLETTGSTATVGTLDLPDDTYPASPADDGTDPDEVAHAEAGGSGGNFKMIVPVRANSGGSEVYTLSIAGQTTQTTGAYSLEKMAFKVAMKPEGGTTVPTGNNTVTLETAPTWTNTGFPADDAVDETETTLLPQIKKVAETSADEDYFVFSVANPGLLTVNAEDDGVGHTKDANTKGTLFGAKGKGSMGEMWVGEIAKDDNSGPGGTHFQFTVPVEAHRHYLVKVEGTEGYYKLAFDFAVVKDTDNSETTPLAPITPPVSPITRTLAASGSTGAQERDLYLFNIQESGTLYVHTTGETDVVGTLYGPNGKNLATDDNGGDDRNFRIVKEVAPGVYILEVKGKKRTTNGKYTLVTSFITGPGPTEPTDPDPDPDPPPPATDAEGELEDPPNDGTRSGIGLIRGWVCQATSVQVRITGESDGASGPITISPVPYGSEREQAAVDRCQHTRNTIGFAAQFNYNLLEEGTYTATASADGQTIDTNTFEVIRISDQEYLTGARAQVEVRDFPLTGDSTILVWDEESQNFQIADHQ